MPINGVRVLPNMPPNVPHLQTLIREFETTFNNWGSHRDSGSQSSVLSSGNFVKKIVQAYEMNMKTSSKNVEQKGLFNNLEIIRNWKNAEKSDSSPTVYEFNSNLPASNNLKIKSTIFSDQSVAETLDDEDDFVTPNLNSNDSTALKTRSRVFSKINMYGPESELPNIPRKKKIGQFFCSPLKNQVEDKSKSNGSMTFSNTLEEYEDKDEDPLDNILTNSRDSSGISNNSYRNLQIDLYDFENEKSQLELSSSSLPSLKSSLKSSHDVLSTSTDSQTIIMTPPMDVSRDSENFQNDESEAMQSCFKLESPRMIGASLKRSIKIDSGVRVTWASAINEKLQKKSLKKLLSTFNSRMSLNCKKISRKSWGKQQKEQQRVVDSGFVEQFSSSLSFLPQKFFNHDEKLAETWRSSPTFETFGHAKTTSECHASSRRAADNPRIVLTEAPHEELADDPELSDPISWVSIRRTPSSFKKHVDLSSKSASFSRLKVSCELPLIPKHPHLSRSRIPKHPFVAQTKMDQIKGETAEEEEVKLHTNMELRLNEQELRSTSTLVPIPALNISYPKTCEWIASSPKSSHDLQSTRSCNSPTFDEVALHQESLVYDVSKQVFNLTTDSTSFIQLHERDQPRKPRYATVNSKNLRFSMSREKLRAIEKSFDA